MARNLVLCADGTCNAFGARHSSNVARLVRLLDLTDASRQMAAYDQGLGTRADEHRAIATFAQALHRPGLAAPLVALAPPRHSSRRLRDWPFIIMAMTAGWGLESNVGELYRALAEHYRPGDHVFLFGFSRGAFTVRALAGFVWRFGIPAGGDRRRADAVFARTWPIYRHEFPDEPACAAAVARTVRRQAGLVDCPILFLGLWDTVKSYGGLSPIMLPHLRHNPAVSVVRHALSLDERRGWFEATTWGWLDADHPAARDPGRGYPADRLDPVDRARIEQQDVREVWFTGCHADVGGGNGNDTTSDIALRWMLGEANGFGLRLNDEADEVMNVPAQRERPIRKESRSLGWSLVDTLGRQAIDNGGRWPVLRPARGPSPRHRDNWRGGVIWVHESVRDLPAPTVRQGCRVEVARTVRGVRQWT